MSDGWNLLCQYQNKWEASWEKNIFREQVAGSICDQKQQLKWVKIQQELKKKTNHSRVFPSENKLGASLDWGRQGGDGGHSYLLIITLSFRWDHFY